MNAKLHANVMNECKFAIKCHKISVRLLIPLIQELNAYELYSCSYNCYFSLSNTFSKHLLSRKDQNLLKDVFQMTVDKMET